MSTVFNAMFAKNKFSLFLSLALLAIFSTSATIIKYKADFTGEWTFSEAKSKLPEGGFRMNATKLKVTPDGEGLAIERTTGGPNGDNTTTDKITFDGKTTESTAFGNSKKKSTAAWSQDGNQMTINSTILFDRDGNTMEFKTTETWKLVDPKTLSIESKSTTPQGERVSTFVYEKK